VYSEPGMAVGPLPGSLFKEHMMTCDACGDIFEDDTAAGGICKVCRLTLCLHYSGGFSKERLCFGCREWIKEDDNEV